ncbi:MAG: hypothetical protein COZ20_07460, partial [Gallionellales bacterium CG_4_10_14_3_um_filter_54_96]
MTSEQGDRSPMTTESATTAFTHTRALPEGDVANESRQDSALNLASYAVSEANSRGRQFVE